MLGGLYERIAAEPGGLRSLASARLRRRVLVLLHKALEHSQMNQSDLAKKLGYRRSAVNQVFRGDGNVRIETLAEYLHEMGYELDLQLVNAGEPRRALSERRPVDHINMEASTYQPQALFSFAGAVNAASVLHVGQGSAASHSVGVQVVRIG